MCIRTVELSNRIMESIVPVDSGSDLCVRVSHCSIYFQPWPSILLIY